MPLPSDHPWPRALAWLLFLGPFFFASYGFATWVASLRSDVGVVVFDWERHIPFLPWTIVPYWIIDLLYGISLFLCATQAQLDTHARRLLTAQLVAVSGFLLFPLRFSFERPPVEGFFGDLFALLGQFDKPFNQMPSLHIALMAILWVVYLRALPRGWHWLVHGSFALIGVSVLTTWQHHFIDVPTGLALGGLCLWLWPDEGPSPLAGVFGGTPRAMAGQVLPTPTLPARGEGAGTAPSRGDDLRASPARGEHVPPSPTFGGGWEGEAHAPSIPPTHPTAKVRQAPSPARRRLARHYALGAITCVLLAMPGGTALWVLWPAGSLALVAAAYLTLGPQAFQKRPDGRLTAAALGLFAPYLLGAWLNARAWTRKLLPATEIVPGLLLGRLPGTPDLDRLDIAAIVDVSAELPCPTGGRPYFNVPMLDLVPPSPAQLEQAAQAIGAARATANGPLLVCCALGFSRSALAVAAWLLAEGRAATPEAAETLIRRAKPAIVLKPAQRASLAAWWATIRPVAP
jgi:protein-tyrosine phosphatase